MKKECEAYLAAALAFGDKQRARDFVAGNPFATKLHRLGMALRVDAEGREFLLGLLGHDDMHVRGWAAKDCLFFDSPEAVKVLEDLGKDDGLRGLAAQTTLSEWRKGRLFGGGA